MGNKHIIAVSAGAFFYTIDQIREEKIGKGWYSKTNGFSGGLCQHYRGTIWDIAYLVDGYLNPSTSLFGYSGRVFQVARDRHLGHTHFTGYIIESDALSFHEKSARP